MKRTIILLVSAAALLNGCAKPVTVNANEGTKRYIEAFVQTHYPEARKTTLGAYVIEDEAGSGKTLGDTSTTPFVHVEFTVTDLDGNIVVNKNSQTGKVTSTMTTSEALCKQLGTYNAEHYYGPVIWYRPEFGVFAGIEESLKEMKVGGRRKLLVPGWLVTNASYSTAAEYEANCTGTNAIYDIRIVEGITDIVKWQLDSIARYLSRNFPKVSPADSAKYGFYYIQRQPPVDTTKFHEDSTFYINYTGRLLNGKVFDTSIADTAKCYNIYSTSKTYSSHPVKYDSDNKVYKMDDGSVVSGFELALERIRYKEKATVIFYSSLGYGSTSSNNAIPAFSPLRFDIEVVDKE